MTKLKPGDRVNCRLKNAFIVSPYQGDYDEIHTFEIIGTDKFGYYLYVPSYFNLKGSTALDEYACSYLLINRKFIGEQTFYIQESMIAQIQSKMDGCYCVGCGEFYHMAQPNRVDNSLICWSCREYPFYR